MLYLILNRFRLLFYNITVLTDFTPVCMKDSLIYITRTLLRKHQIKIPDSELAFQISSHPSFPSLHAVTGVLQHFGIETMALRIPQDEESLNHLEGYFMAQVDDAGQHLVVATRVGASYEVIYDQNRVRTMPVEEFLARWTGVVLVVDEDAQVDMGVGNRESIRILQGITALGILVVPFFMDLSLYQLLHYGLSIIGLLIGILIIQHELGIDSRALEKFCSSNHRKTDCAAVLRSEGALLFGRWKLSNLVLVYFIGLIASWIMLSVLGLNDSFLRLASWSAVLMTFYSIYYQFGVIQAWCSLCLSVVAVIWMQAGVLWYFEGQYPLDFHYPSVLVTILGFLMAGVGWDYLIRQLHQNSDYQRMKVDHYRFKRNYNLFKTMLNQSGPISVSVFEREIVFGHPGEESVPTITLITNPSCGFCKEAHAIIAPVLKASHRRFKILVRFNVYEGVAGNLPVRIAGRLLRLYHQDTPERCLEAMDDIYGGMKPDEWFSKWGEKMENEDLELLRRQKEWCASHAINFTPEILVNGKSFPKEYQRGDLVYFVEDLLEEWEMEVQLPH